jgi:hypothetical protein
MESFSPAITLTYPPYAFSFCISKLMSWTFNADALKLLQSSLHYKQLNVYRLKVCLPLKITYSGIWHFCWLINSCQYFGGIAVSIFRMYVVQKTFTLLSKLLYKNIQGIPKRRKLFSTWHGVIFQTFISISTTLFITDNYLTAWSRDLPEKLIGLQLVKKFTTLYEILRFITAFTRARHLSLFWARSIQSIPPSHFYKIYFNIILLSTPWSSKCIL